MSSASVVLTNREKSIAELSQELESLRAMNRSLSSYLDQLRGFKRHLATFDNNCKSLYKVNTQWLEVIDNKR